MKKIIILCAGLAVACASQRTHETRAIDVVLNPTHDIEGCKFLGVVDTEASDDWKNDIRKKAAEVGATAVTAKEPSRIDERAQPEKVIGNAYFCQSLKRQ